MSVGDNSRITQQQALEMFASSDLLGLGQRADRVRQEKHPEGVVSYQIDRFR